MLPPLQWLKRSLLYLLLVGYQGIVAGPVWEAGCWTRQVLVFLGKTNLGSRSFYFTWCCIRWPHRVVAGWACSPQWRHETRQTWHWRWRCLEARVCPQSGCPSLAFHWCGCRTAGRHASFDGERQSLCIPEDKGHQRSRIKTTISVEKNSFKKEFEILVQILWNGSCASLASNPLPATLAIAGEDCGLGLWDFYSRAVMPSARPLICCLWNCFQLDFSHKEALATRKQAR